MSTHPEMMAEFLRRSAGAEDENWRFRTFLKGCDRSARQLDLDVQRLYREVAAGIDCTACGRCCQKLSPLVAPADVRSLARALELPEAEFRGRYVEETKEEGEHTLRLKGPPCPLQADRKCTVYEHRPADCRSYPHLHKKDFVFRLIRAVENATICPIAYFVFERLKADLWHGSDAWQEEDI